MNKLIGKSFIVFGLLFLLSSVILYKAASIEVQFGMIWNIVLFFWDCLWFLGLGIFFVLAGIAVNKGGREQVGKIRFGGYLLIFTTVFWVSTFIFNAFAHPIFQSNGRIFAYCLQICPRLIRPAFSPDFLVPLGSILVFFVIAVWFERIFMHKINEERNQT